MLALAYITFLGSMLIANDMALLTFLPLGYFVLSSTGKEKYMAFTFIMQNIAANLGGMLTPFGNPQNLYLYTKFNIPTGEFTLTMLPPFLISVTLITLCCLVFVKKNAVLCVALVAALVTSFLVPPDAQYLNYFDWKTLTCLFCVLAVVCALKNIRFFTLLAERVVAIF